MPRGWAASTRVSAMDHSLLLCLESSPAPRIYILGPAEAEEAHLPRGWAASTRVSAMGYSLLLCLESSPAPRIYILDPAEAEEAHLPRGSAASTRMSGFRPLTAVATPASMPPPEMGTITASRLPCVCCISSSPKVPCTHTMVISRGTGQVEPVQAEPSEAELSRAEAECPGFCRVLGPCQAGQAQTGIMDSGG